MNTKKFAFVMSVFLALALAVTACGENIRGALGMPPTLAVTFPPLYTPESRPTVTPTLPSTSTPTPEPTITATAIAEVSSVTVSVGQEVTLRNTDNNGTLLIRYKELIDFDGSSGSWVFTLYSNIIDFEWSMRDEVDAAERRCSKVHECGNVGFRVQMLRDTTIPVFVTLQSDGSVLVEAESSWTVAP